MSLKMRREDIFKQLFSLFHFIVVCDESKQNIQNEYYEVIDTLLLDREGKHTAAIITITIINVSSQ